MNRIRETVLGIAVGVATLSLIGWGLWAMCAGSESDNKIVAITDTKKPVNEPETTPMPAPTPAVEIEDADAVGTWESLKLPIANSPSSGPGRIEPNQPEPPLTVNQVVYPMVQGVTIHRDSPDQCTKQDIVGRTVEMFGLMKFDLSKLPEPPQKAVLRACVFYLENANGYATPAQLVFYRVKTEWDDSATFRYANARDQVKWANGDYFNASSPTDIDLTPVATVVIPNPPKPGFNLEVDITPVVAAWKTGEYPNYGLLMRCDFKMGTSTQANLATRKYTSRYMPQILCTFTTPQRSSAQSDQPTMSAPRSGGMFARLGRVFAPAPPSTRPATPSRLDRDRFFLLDFEFGMEVVKELSATNKNLERLQALNQRTYAQLQEVLAAAEKDPQIDSTSRMLSILRQHSQEARQLVDKNDLELFAAIGKELALVSTAAPDELLGKMGPLGLTNEQKASLRTSIVAAQQKISQADPSNLRTPEAKRAQMTISLAAHREIRQLLTPEQRTQWISLLATMSATESQQR